MAIAKPKTKASASPKSKAKAKAAPAATARSVVANAKAQGVQMIDFKFVDFPGTWQHFSIPASTLEEDMFSEGLGFDGSSIRGWKSIDESDMLVMPDPTTAFRDPFCEIPTLSIICDIVDPITREDYGRDPPQRRQAGRGLPEVHRPRRHRVLRAGSGVLHLRQHPVRPERALLLPLHRLRRGALELRRRRAAEPRVQAALQGRILPGTPARHAAGPALGDGADDDGGRRRRRGPPPRGRHRRTG